MGELEIWLLLTYTLGTVFGWWMATKNRNEIIADTVDFLIAEGYLDSEIDSDGNIEVKKLNK